MGLTTVIWRETGRVIVCSDEIASRWITAGLAVLPVRGAVETTSRTTVPHPASLAGVETR